MGLIMVRLIVARLFVAHESKQRAGSGGSLDLLDDLDIYRCAGLETELQ